MYNNSSSYNKRCWIDRHECSTETISLYVKAFYFSVGSKSAHGRTACLNVKFVDISVLSTRFTGFARHVLKCLHYYNGPMEISSLFSVNRYFCKTIKHNAITDWQCAVNTWLYSSVMPYRVGFMRACVYLWSMLYVTKYMYCSSSSMYKNTCGHIDVYF